MPIERWGSLSVDDHLDVNALIANVLLYDRLVLPVCTKQPDRDEWKYWQARGWSPETQFHRLEQLGKLAVQRPWDRERRKSFRARYEQLLAEREAVSDSEARQLTRAQLADEMVLEKPSGVHQAEVIAAYSSLANLRKDFEIASEADNLAAQALLITRRLAVPDLKDPEDSLKEAINLSLDPGFREKRSSLFDWQSKVVSDGLEPQAAVNYLDELVGKYNATVIEAAGTVKLKFAFTITSATVGFFTGGAVGAGAAAAISLLQFLTLDRKPVIEPGNAAPVAMFHDVEARLGYVLR